MRVAFLVYGVLYVVIEIVGYQLEQVSWPEITALDVATAVTNAFLTVAVLVAVLVAVDVLGHRWRRSRRIARLERARLDAAAEWIDGEWIDGEWIDGEWIDGEWIDGEWIDAEWIDAEEVGAGPITVQAWRPEPLALPAAPAPVRTLSAPNAYARQAWPEDAGTDSAARLL